MLLATDSDEVIMACNRSSVLRALQISSHKPRRRPFDFINRAFQQLGGLFAILLILGWATPAQFIELSKTSQRAPKDSSRRAKPVTYLALGDSTCLGLGAQNGYGYVERLMSRIETKHSGSRLLKLCRLGETTASLRQRLTESFSVKPTFVTLSIGMNDLLQGISEQEFAANYEAIVIRLRQLAVPIVITNLPDISFAPRLPKSMREEIHVKVLLFNKQIEAIAKRYGLLFVDLYEASSKMITAHSKFFSADGFHPSNAGYEFWTRIMWPTVKIAIKRSSKVSQHHRLTQSVRAQLASRVS
jgi:acyl-CoA thioesterase I